MWIREQKEYPRYPVDGAGRRQVWTTEEALLWSFDPPLPVLTSYVSLLEDDVGTLEGDNLAPFCPPDESLPLSYSEAATRAAAGKEVLFPFAHTSNAGISRSKEVQQGHIHESFGSSAGESNFCCLKQRRKTKHFVSFPPLETDLLKTLETTLST